MTEVNKITTKNHILQCVIHPIAWTGYLLIPGGRLQLATSDDLHFQFGVGDLPEFRFTKKESRLGKGHCTYGYTAEGVSFLMLQAVQMV